MDGFNAEHIFDRRTGYAYDDLIILPGYIDFPVSSINLKSKLTKNIELNIPIVSSPMDTVTEYKMAIAMALQGGIGIIHCNNNVYEQVEHIKKVFSSHPIVIFQRKIFFIHKKCSKAPIR